MNILYGLLFAFGCVGTALGDLTCTLGDVNIAAPWQDMEQACIQKMHEQVKKEIEASMTYLKMGAYFSKDSLNRPGFAKFFFDSASEEREHAIKILEYLLMRGQLESIKDVLYQLTPKAVEWKTGKDALNRALELEVTVTASIRDMIAVCEKPHQKKGAKIDYHLVDYLTHDFLDEQYKGQRDLAGKISTLGKMSVANGDSLAEFLFDKKLLNGEI